MTQNVALEPGWAPAACTLPTAERPLRVAEFDALFADALQAKIAEVDARIADLTTIRAALTQVVSAGCDSLTHCTCPDCPLPFAGLARRPNPGAGRMTSDAGS